MAGFIVTYTFKGTEAKARRDNFNKFVNDFSKTIIKEKNDSTIIGKSDSRLFTEDQTGIIDKLLAKNEKLPEDSKILTKEDNVLCIEIYENRIINVLRIKELSLIEPRGIKYLFTV